MALGKSTIPLESDPKIFTKLIHDLGMSRSLAFTDVYSLDEATLSFIPRPVLGLILVHPTPPDYEDEVHQRERAACASSLAAMNWLWFQQTIHNACGLYAILHTVSNGLATSFIGKWASSYRHD
jgi:ubiquitin carboxyl-terminal hydrolase L3